MRRILRAKRVMRRAAEMLESEAQTLFMCHSFAGEWAGAGSDEAKAEHDEMLQIAADLRDLSAEASHAP
ncbi:hypothetical protein [Denitromonas halophila]|uniref:Uncharacterized protein n=1 Tax=Denitromonas halophila TaxID=1629404 RepID=A0A557QXC7_9RHOO|nr:hypothetical protein [Denitromonas halophila]TVO57565.1 hypothetical protein FHP91_07765 [Denitromonas halophila]